MHPIFQPQSEALSVHISFHPNNTPLEHELQGGERGAGFFIPWFTTEFQCLADFSGVIHDW